MCANALLEGRERGEIRYEWNALRPHFSNHLLRLLPPPIRSCSASLLLFVLHWSSLSLSWALSLPFSFPFVLLNSASTYILHSLYLHTAKSFAWFHENSSIPELKFKGGAAVRAVCSTRRESIIFYVHYAAQARLILFVLLQESPAKPSGIFVGLSSFRFRFMLFFCSIFHLILLYLIYIDICISEAYVFLNSKFTLI